MRLAPRAFYRDERGAILVQVIAISMVLLGVMYMGFRSVQSTIRLANSTATSAEFKDVVLGLEQLLAVTDQCMLRLGAPGGVFPLANAQSSDGIALSITGPDGNAILHEEPSTLTNIRLSGTLEYVRVRLANAKLAGWGDGAVPGGGKQEFVRYLGEIEIRARRRAEFLGAAEMAASVPILLLVKSGTPTISKCSVRRDYLTELGPKVMPPGFQRKTGLECYDRGGVPAIFPGDDFVSCRIPISSYGLCSSGPPARGSLPGWYCYRSFSYTVNALDGVSYVY